MRRRPWLERAPRHIFCNQSSDLLLLLLLRVAKCLIHCLRNSGGNGRSLITLLPIKSVEQQ